MKPFLAIFAVGALALASTSPADAKGCLKGAVVGGVAGHYAGHHGVLGAAAGLPLRPPPCQGAGAAGPDAGSAAAGEAVTSLSSGNDIGALSVVSFRGHRRQ
jgi:hypothetical protein